MTSAFDLVRRHLTAMVVVLVAIAGPLSAATAEAAGPVHWYETAGVQSSNMLVQSNFFFPSDITVDSGDSITWTQKSGEFHTVTFLSGMPAPDLISGGGINPQVLFASGGNTYSGSGYVNSGLFGIAGNPTTFTLKFTTPGDYQYNCLVHSTMKGVVHVQATGAPYPHSQSFYDSQAKAAEARSIGQGYALAAVGLADALSAGVGNVTAGIGRLYSSGSIMIAGFLPKIEFVHVGQSVTWTNRDPETPHTVTFNLEGFDANNPLIAFAPINTNGDGTGTMSSTSEDLNSGVIGAGAPTTFKVKFTSPGTYNYYCALHDELGMKGAVVVLP